VSDKGKEKGDVTVAVPATVNERLGVICKRTGMSKRRVVKVLLEFALPTYEARTGEMAPSVQANPGTAPVETPPVAQPEAGNEK
jgi:hypothetical protein